MHSLRAGPQGRRPPRRRGRHHPPHLPDCAREDSRHTEPGPNALPRDAAYEKASAGSSQITAGEGWCVGGWAAGCGGTTRGARGERERAPPTHPDPPPPPLPQPPRTLTVAVRLHRGAEVKDRGEGAPAARLRGPVRERRGRVGGLADVGEPHRAAVQRAHGVALRGAPGGREEVARGGGRAVGADALVQRHGAPRARRPAEPRARLVRRGVVGGVPPRVLKHGQLDGRDVHYGGEGGREVAVVGGGSGGRPRRCERRSSMERSTQARRARHPPSSYPPALPLRHSRRCCA